jgi:hypothetical protein
MACAVQIASVKEDPYSGSAPKTSPAGSTTDHPSPAESHNGSSLTDVIPLGQAMREGEDAKPCHRPKEPKNLSLLAACPPARHLRN